MRISSWMFFHVVFLVMVSVCKADLKENEFDFSAINNCQIENTAYYLSFAAIDDSNDPVSTTIHRIPLPVVGTPSKTEYIWSGFLGERKYADHSERDLTVNVEHARLGFWKFGLSENPMFMNSGGNFVVGKLLKGYNTYNISIPENGYGQALYLIDQLVLSPESMLGVPQKIEILKMSWTIEQTWYGFVRKLSSGCVFYKRN